MQEMPIGKGRCLKTGDGKLAVLALGPRGNLAMQAISEIENESDACIGLFDMIFLNLLMRNCCRRYVLNTSGWLPLKMGY